MRLQSEMSRALYLELEQTTWSAAYSVAAKVERPLITGDTFAVRQWLQRISTMFPDVRYVIVRNTEGQIICHTFHRHVPRDLLAVHTSWNAGSSYAKVLGSSEGLIFDVVAQVSEGRAGTVQLGVGDRRVAQVLHGQMNVILQSLALCLVVGLGLAVMLARILTRPILGLLETTHRIRAGEFEARAKITSTDEIGRLAMAFNQMAQGLEHYRAEVKEKEQARLALMGKIVHAQEEERKIIARELHDHLGHSLLTLLLTVQSSRFNQENGGVFRQIERKITDLVDEVRRLAWGMRPSLLDDYGLPSALGRYMEDLGSRSRVRVDYQFVGPSSASRLPDDVEMMLFRIAQEAMSNFLRHADTDRASVVLWYQEYEATLLVEDQGRGFDPLTVGRSEYQGMGLTNMKERAAMVGGHCEIISAPTEGTTIRVRVPLNSTRGTTGSARGNARHVPARGADHGRVAAPQAVLDGKSACPSVS